MTSANKRVELASFAVFLGHLNILLWFRMLLTLKPEGCISFFCGPSYYTILVEYLSYSPNHDGLARFAYIGIVSLYFSSFSSVGFPFSRVALFFCSIPS